MDTPVSFELAKLLKEKGFDLGVINYYSGLNLYIDKFRFNYNDKTIGDSFMHKRNGGCYSAPTIAEVVMWLYEKHGIWIEVSKLDGYQNLFFYTITGSNGFNHGAKITVIEWDDDKCDEMGYNNKYKHSPTEAYEAAITYCLNNLL